MSKNNLGYVSAIDDILMRARSAAREPDQGFPHYAETRTGSWTRSQGGDWTGGFFVGQLWLGSAAGYTELRSDASEWAKLLVPRTRSKTIFRGFLFWYGAALGDKLLGDPAARSIALDGAIALAQSFNPTIGLLPLGSDAEEAASVGEGETNIDGVPGGAPLLFWAAESSGDESLHRIATAHVSKHIELLVRSDGSVIQSAGFDPVSGQVLRSYTHKGVSDQSTWARAQAWAMLGIAQAAKYEPALFTSEACRVCDWWCDHLPESGVAPWDFDAYKYQQDPVADTSATAIAASALLKVTSLNIPVDKARRYKTIAVRMVDALLGEHFTGSGNTYGVSGVLRDGCYNYKLGLATHHELIWGTYYLLETLLSLSGRLAIEEL